MGLGILEDKKWKNVPGTVLLNANELQQDAPSALMAKELKHGTGRNSHIILSPQPSDDPNDPLNWPQLSKDVNLLVLSLGAMLHAAVSGPMLSAGIVTIALDLGVTITDVAVLAGYQLLVVGISGPFVCAISRKYGKRPMFLFSALMGVIGAIVGSISPNYSTLVAARILQGLSSSAFESIIVTVIGDMYFVHQRGLRVALFSLVIGTIGNGTAIVAGVITTNMGWHWLFILLAIFAGVQFVAMFFLCPETTYVRLDSHQIGQVNQLGRTVTLEQTELEYIDKFGKKHLHTVASIPKHYEESISRITTRTIPRKKSYGQSLAIWNSKFTDESLISHVIAPFMTVFNPGALYILVSSAFMIASFVAVSFILAAVFSAPPYLFTAAQVGYLSIGPTIGGLLGTIFMGLIDEPMVKYFTKRNHGIYEPEFRLVAMIPSAIFSSIGLFAYGHSLQMEVAAEVAAFIHGIMIFGIIIGTIATTGYLLDAYRELSSEVFIMSMVSKNFLFYGYSFVVNNWVAEKGPAQMFDVFGIITLTMVWFFMRYLTKVHCSSPGLFLWETIERLVGKSAYVAKVVRRGISSDRIDNAAWNPRYLAGLEDQD